MALELVDSDAVFTVSLTLFEMEKIIIRMSRNLKITFFPSPRNASFIPRSRGRGRFLTKKWVSSFHRLWSDKKEVRFLTNSVDEICIW